MTKISQWFGRVIGTSRGRATIAGAGVLVIALVAGALFVLRDGGPGAFPGQTPVPSSPVVTGDGAVSMAGRAPLTGVPSTDEPGRPSCSG